MTPAAKAAVKPYLIFFKAEEGLEGRKAVVFTSENACEKWKGGGSDAMFTLKCHSEVIFSCRASDIKFVHDYNNEILESRIFDKKIELDKDKELVIP